MKIFYILTIIILLLSILAIIYVTIYNSLQERLLKKKEAESEIDETLRTKYDILNKLKDLLNKGLKGKDANCLDTLTKMEKITDEKLTSFELYRSLIDFENKMLRLKENAKKMNNIQDFENEFEKIEDINVRLSGEIKYYNDVISSYMKIYSKLPGVIIAKTAKLKDERYFDNRNLDDSVEKDFQI